MTPLCLESEDVQTTAIPIPAVLQAIPELPNKESRFDNLIILEKQSSYSS